MVRTILDFFILFYDILKHICICICIIQFLLILFITHMESTNDVLKTGKIINQGFFNTVFNMDGDSKAEMLNLVQYIIIANHTVCIYS